MTVPVEVRMHRAQIRAHRRALEFAERGHRRQMLGNVATSFFQSLAANRPLQVATALGALQVGRGVGRLISPEISSGNRFVDALKGLTGSIEDVALTGAMVAYLTNSDGGASIQYDIPDVESPGGGAAVAGGDGFPFSSRRR